MSIVKSTSGSFTGLAVHSGSKDRSHAPVFVLGCPRSGTTVLYHMLLSAGDFAVYRAESNVFNLLVPRFRGMRTEKDRRDLLRVWLRSKAFRVSGLDRDEISEKIISTCRNGGDFLRTVMAEVAVKQGVQRWADCTPDHLLYMQEIKRQIPEALFIHIIRDGRDVALSYSRQNWSHPLPWDETDRLAVAGLYWEWVVKEGRKDGQRLAEDYQEVRFEDLIANPQESLTKLGEFIEHDLDYEKIQQRGIGSVSEPNSSFAREKEKQFNPVGRWKTTMSAEEVASLEDVIGGFLNEMGYGLSSSDELKTGQMAQLRALRLRATYLSLFSMKRRLKKTVLGRTVHLKNLELQQSDAQH